VSPILNEVFSQVLKHSKEDSKQPIICERNPEISEKRQKVESVPEKTNTLPPSISSFTMNLFARKPRLQLVPYVVDEESDSSTIRTSPDEHFGDDNNKITGNKSSQFSREDNTASVKRKRKRKSDTVPQQPEVLLTGTGNDSSTSASSVDGKRKRKSEIVLQQQPEAVLSTGNDSSNSASSVDGKRKRKSEIVLQKPEVVATGNDSSNSASSVTDLGKGKRIRVKNVRLLDI
jgi:hypothetical protein